VLYLGDALLSMAAIRNISNTGWYTNSDLLGVPFGQNLLDFPAAGDYLHMAGLRLLTVVTDAPGLVLNLFYFSSFATVFLGAYAGCRLLSLTKMSSVSVGVLFAFLPFHSLHGPNHLFLSSYGVVPMWIALAVRQMGDCPLVVELPPLRPSGWWNWLRQPGNTGAVTIVVLGSTTGLYYAVFMVVTLLVAGLAGWAKTSQQSRLLTASVLLAVTFAVLAVQFTPTWLLNRRIGSNAEIVERGLANIEYYSLKLSDLVLPVAGHRVQWLADLRVDAQALTLRGEQAGAIGLLGVIGLLVLAATTVTRLLRGNVGGRRGSLAVVAGSAFVVATVGGGATVLGVAGFTYLRAWGRIAIVLAFCGLVAVALGYEGLRRRPRGLLSSFLVAFVVILGLLDTNPGMPFPDYDRTANSWSSDEAFVREIEQRFGADATLFQLPIIPFPEHPPVHRMIDYAHLRGYLHSKTLGWSYGGVKGRAADWQERLDRLSVDQVAEAVAAAGFDGLWLDRFGYGPELSEIEMTLGAPTLESNDGRLVMYDLRDLAVALREDLGAEAFAAWATRLLEPVTISFGSGFHGVEGTEGRMFAWAPDTATLAISNPTEGDRTVRVSFIAASAVDGSWILEVLGTGSVESFDLSSGGVNVDLQIVVPPGGRRLRLQTDAQRLETTDHRDLRFRVFDLVLEPAGLSDA
jgi:phosphoglycerol transferase